MEHGDQARWLSGCEDKNTKPKMVRRIAMENQHSSHAGPMCFSLPTKEAIFRALFIILYTPSILLISISILLIFTSIFSPFRPPIHFHSLAFIRFPF